MLLRSSWAGLQIVQMTLDLRGGEKEPTAFGSMSRDPLWNQIDLFGSFHWKSIFKFMWCNDVSRSGRDHTPFRSSRCRSFTCRHVSLFTLFLVSFFNQWFHFRNGGQHLRSIGRADAKIPGYRSGSPVRLRWIELLRSSYLFLFLISRS